MLRVSAHGQGDADDNGLLILKLLVDSGVTRALHHVSFRCSNYTEKNTYHMTSIKKAWLLSNHAFVYWYRKNRL